MLNHPFLTMCVLSHPPLSLERKGGVSFAENVAHVLVCPEGGWEIPMRETGQVGRKPQL